MTEQDVDETESGSDTTPGSDAATETDGPEADTPDADTAETTETDVEEDGHSDEAFQSALEDISGADPETIAERFLDMQGEIESLKGERAELKSKLKRKQAEFQNYKKRTKERHEEEKKRATEDLVSRLLDVRDNLERALEQDEDTDIRSGVESTFRQFDDILQAENVEPVDPEPGSAVEPTRHQVLARVESDQEPGTIAEVHRSGYEMAGKVLREAQVTVSEES
jgi:molecular chaperone GrpE